MKAPSTKFTFKLRHSASSGTMLPFSDTRVLPDEVLATIFEHIVAIWEDDQDHDFTALGQTLKCLTVTCRNWREVALSTPRLWRNIYNADPGEGDWYSPEDLSPEDSPTLAPTYTANSYRSVDAGAAYFSFETCLRRSGVVPLRLYAEKSCGLCDLLIRLAESKASERVYFIELRDFFRPLPEFDDDFDFNKLDYLHCPNLRSVAASSMGTALFVDLYDMLSFHPGIESLSLKNVWWAWGDMEARELPLLMPKLRDFKISHHQHSGFVKTFEMLRMPNLERLSIEKTYIEISALPSLGAIVINQTFPLVNEVAIVGPLTTRDITNILDKASNTETLQLRNGIYDDYEELFTRLEYRPWDEAVLCPNLRHITLQRCPVTPHAVIAMAESRFENNRPLISIATLAEEWAQWPAEAINRLAAVAQVANFIPGTT
ncbi:hypothetical protein CALVIDRAFT_596649 [Calocera viscosa TUFC12733]|uniref:F-box domain-containing protein n=1 Tax=Calocera viscosa (strain TUFC12733) TaxID=1330018 RepID=A0A167P8P4_CALVF|nr:hypothetical protein CALVIDRAFT_596649 [Calocera viscosa TUFC12733]